MAALGKVAERWSFPNAGKVSPSPWGEGSTVCGASELLFCSGGDHYHDVRVALNGAAYKAFKGGELKTVKPQTRNKLYVACSRARGNLYLVPDQMFRKFKST